MRMAKGHQATLHSNTHYWGHCKEISRCNNIFKTWFEESISLIWIDAWIPKYHSILSSWLVSIQKIELWHKVGTRYSTDRDAEDSFRYWAPSWYIWRYIDKGTTEEHDQTLYKGAHQGGYWIPAPRDKIGHIPKSRRYFSTFPIPNFHPCHPAEYFCSLLRALNLRRW